MVKTVNYYKLLEQGWKGNIYLELLMKPFNLRGFLLLYNGEIQEIVLVGKQDKIGDVTIYKRIKMKKEDFNNSEQLFQTLSKIRKELEQLEVIANW